jgi:uncharacterized surface protein with fasciclin (FAS1) repeats
MSLLALIAAALVGPSAASAAGGKNIVERTIQINRLTGAFDTLLAAATCTPGIADALATSQDITVFAPTDGAFRKLGLDRRNVCDALDDAARADVLTYHVLPAKVTYQHAVRVSPTTLTMLNGDPAELTGSWFTLRIDEARVILPNIRASNGLIHVVSSVLLPPD